MSNTKQRLALAIIEYLNTSLTDGTLTEEDRESVEVAQSCISDLYKVDSTSDNVSKDSQTLLQIYSVYEKLKTKAPAATSPAPPAASSPSTTSPAIPESQKQEAESLKSLGNSSMAKKDYKSAIELYTQALAIIPGNPIFLSNRAAAYSASKDHVSACADAEAAVAVDPTYTKAWSRLGLARFALGDAKGSKEAYAKGIEYEGNGGSDAMKKGFETASKRVEEIEATGGNTVTDRSAPGAAAGGFPDLSSLAGMLGGGAGGAGGMPDLSSIMSNPMFASMAQNLMSNPDMMKNIMNNPRLAEIASQLGGGGGSGGRGGGQPDLSSLMQDPNIAEMANKFLGGAGRGAGQ